MHEGETPLLRLVEHLRGDGDLSKVPNLIYREEGIVKVNRPFAKEELNALPTPDFDGLPLDLYLSPTRVLPVMGSRGLLLGEMCILFNPLRPYGFFMCVMRKMWSMTFKVLQEKYNCDHFFFTDEALPINFLRTFAAKIIEQKIDVQWTGELKF